MLELEEQFQGLEVQVREKDKRADELRDSINRYMTQGLGPNFNAQIYP